MRQLPKLLQVDSFEQVFILAELAPVGFIFLHECGFVGFIFLHECGFVKKTLNMSKIVRCAGPLQGSSTTISTLTVPTALTDPRNVINRPLPLQREIVLAHRKVLPLDSVQAPPSLLLACRAHHPRAPPAAGRARATVLRESRTLAWIFGR